jgi:hypothetical protein
MKYEVFVDDLVEGVAEAGLPAERVKRTIAELGSGGCLVFPCPGKVRVRSLSFSGPPVHGDLVLVDSKLVIFVVKKPPMPQAVAVELEALEGDKHGRRRGQVFLAMLQPAKSIDEVGAMLAALPRVASLEIRLH